MDTISSVIEPAPSSPVPATEPLPVAVPVRSIADHVDILAAVATAARDLRSAGVDRIVVELSVDHDPLCVELVVRPARYDDYGQGEITRWVAHAGVPDEAIRIARALLPDAARALGSGADVPDLVYVRWAGGYWHITPFAGCLRPMSSDPDPAHAAMYAWLQLGGPRSCGIGVVPCGRESLFFDVEDYRITGGGPYFERVHAFRALRTADSDRDLPEPSDPIVTSLHRSFTTGARHESRCRAARAAVMQYVLDECWVDRAEIAQWVVGVASSPVGDWWDGIPRVGGRVFSGDDADRILSAIAAFELHGIGGSLDISGGATVTMSWRRGLGKGRRQATDGGAWDAAIRSMIPSSTDDHVSPDDALMAIPFVRPVDLEWPMAYALDRAYQTRSDAEESRRWCDVARAVMARAEEPGSPSESGALRLGWRYGVTSGGVS